MMLNGKHLLVARLTSIARRKSNGFAIVYR
jgi:hypothetical protein